MNHLVACNQKNGGKTDPCGIKGTANAVDSSDFFVIIIGLPKDFTDKPV